MVRYGTERNGAERLTTRTAGSSSFLSLSITLFLVEEAIFIGYRRWYFFCAVISTVDRTELWACIITTASSITT